ncbi:MAG: diiron oxygenase [Acidobacteriota bacterium]
MISEELRETAEKLVEQSRQSLSNPYESLQFPASVPVGEEWFTSPELISIHGTPAFDGMDDAQQRKLSFYEAVNFFSLNIHGEKALLEGLARRLYDPELTELSPYLHHFLDEENKHMIYFGTFCSRYGGKVYEDRTIAFHRQYAPGEESFLFFARVLIFEEIVDYFNRKMARDERLNKVARRINALHHADEARHLVFGRSVVRELFVRFAGQWSAGTLLAVRQHLLGYFRVVWREYYNPEMFKDAGIAHPRQLAERTFSEEEAPRALRERVSQSTVDYFLKHGILLGKPSL